MIAPDTARAASEALWAAMVELAETGNDRVVEAQSAASPVAAAAIATIATELTALADAAAVLARYGESAP